LRQKDTWVVFSGISVQAEACTTFNGDLLKVEELQIYLKIQISAEFIK
jgi:hypothetical protein